MEGDHITPQRQSRNRNAEYLRKDAKAAKVRE